MYKNVNECIRWFVETPTPSTRNIFRIRRAENGVNERNYSSYSFKIPKIIGVAKRGNAVYLF